MKLESANFQDLLQYVKTTPTKKVISSIEEMVSAYIDKVDYRLKEIPKRVHDGDNFNTRVSLMRDRMKYLLNKYEPSGKMKGTIDLVFIIEFIKFIHFCYGYYDAFIVCYLDETIITTLEGPRGKVPMSFRDIYADFDYLAYGVDDNHSLETYVITYIADFGHFIDDKLKLLEFCKRGKADFLHKKKIGSKYNFLSLGSKVKERNDATQVVDKILKDLKKSAVENKLSCVDINRMESAEENVITYQGMKMSGVSEGQESFVSIIVCVDNPKCTKKYTLRYDSYDTSPNNICDSLNACVLIQRLLNEKIVYTGISPHIELYLENAICNDIKPAKWKTEGSNPVVDPLDVMMLVTELAEDHDTANSIWYSGNQNSSNVRPDRINFNNVKGFSNDDVMLIILFQVFYTLAWIRYFFPNFRYGGNTLVQKSDPSKKFYYYVIDDNVYEIPNTGFSARISNFSCSEIPGVIDNGSSYCDDDDLKDIVSLLEYSKNEKLFSLWNNVNNGKYTTPNECLEHFSQFKVKNIPRKKNIRIFGMESEIAKKMKKRSLFPF